MTPDRARTPSDFIAPRRGNCPDNAVDSESHPGARRYRMEFE